MDRTCRNRAASFAFCLITPRESAIVKSIIAAYVRGRDSTQKRLDLIFFFLFIDDTVFLFRYLSLAQNILCFNSLFSRFREFFIFQWVLWNYRFSYCQSDMLFLKSIRVVFAVSFQQMFRTRYINYLQNLLGILQYFARFRNNQWRNYVNTFL